METINPVDLPEVLSSLFPDGTIADVWQDYSHGEWVIGDYNDTAVTLNMTFSKLVDAENVLLQNNIAYRIRDYSG